MTRIPITCHEHQIDPDGVAPVFAMDADVHLYLYGHQYDGERVADLDVVSFLKAKGWTEEELDIWADNIRRNLARRMGNMVLLHQNADLGKQRNVM